MSLKEDLEIATQKTDDELLNEFKRIREEQKKANDKLNSLCLEEYVIKFEINRRNTKNI